MSSSPRILIVGGVAGGASAAARARRLSESASIVVFERGPSWWVAGVAGAVVAAVWNYITTSRAVW